MQNLKGLSTLKDRSRPPKLEPLTTTSSMDLTNNISPQNSNPILLTKPHYQNPSSKKGPAKIAGPYYISYGSPNQMKNLSFPTEEDLTRGHLGINSSALSKINTNAHSSLSSSPYDMSPRVSLPTLGHSQFAKSPLRTEDPSTAVSLYHHSQSWGNMNDTDFVKQSAYISQSPHFAKFSKSSVLLGQIEAKKSSLAKELFYYPEQIEANKKFLQSQLEANMDKEDEDAGITTVIENKRFEVNLLQGRRAYFRLYCYKKFLPVKFQIDIYNGAFEVCISKTKRRPGTAGYDYLYSINDFEVNYENRSDLKYLYFKVKALERLQIRMMVSFKGAPPKLELPAISRSAKKLQKSHKKKSIYEFFSKDMGQQEFLQLKEIAEAIKAERKEKIAKITRSSRDIVQENKVTVARYDELKLLEFIKSRQRDEMRIQQAKQNQLMLQEERQKRQICEFFREDLKKMKSAYETDANDKKRRLMYFQLNFFLTTAVINLCKAIKERKTALGIVKLIQERLHQRAAVIQKGVRVMIGRPLHVQENKFGERVFSDAQSRDALRIVEAMNAWANMMKPIKTEKAEGVIFSFMEDLLLPFRASKGINKYSKKVTKVQREWKKQMTVNKSRLDTFVKHWEEYCMVLMKEEKSKSKKPNTDMIHRISDDKVKTYGKKFIRDKVRLLIKTSRAFLSIGKKTESEPEGASNFITEVPEAALKREPDAPLNIGSRPRLKLKPTMEEFKTLFDGMVAEVEAERQSTRR